jgi:hypothetical protein
VVLSNIKLNVEFTPHAKRKIVELASSSRSFRSTPGAMKAALQLVLPMTKESVIDRVVPARSSITEWTLFEAEYDQVAVFTVIGDSKYGVLCDGSKRARKDLFLIAIFWFDKTTMSVYTKLINIVDLQHDASAEAMCRALLWTLQVRCKLKLTNLAYFCTDNTNSMSGLSGGCVAMLCQAVDILPLPRAPCVLHVWHLAIRSMRAVIYFGEMPAKLDRATKHLWNFLWALARHLYKTYIKRKHTTTTAVLCCVV